MLENASQNQLLTFLGLILTAIIAPTWLSWWNTRQTKREFKPNGGSSIKDSLNRLEVSVSASRQTSLTLASAIGVAYFQSDSKGDYRYVSREWQKMAGMFAEDAMGNGWINGIHPDDRVKVVTEWREANNHGKPLRVNCRMATGVTVNITANPIKSSSGTIEGYVGFCETEDTDEPIGFP